MISIGIIGCGAVTHLNYAPTLTGHDEYGVRYVFDTDETQAASAAALFGCEVTSLEKLLADSNVVLVATPPRSHASLVQKALRPGRVVVCEKPFMLTHEDARRAVVDAQTADTRLYVGHARRTYPQVELARQLVELGTVGEVTGITAREGGRITWRTVSNYLMRDSAGGGVLWDMGSHTLDMALFAAGLDGWSDPTIEVLEIARDGPEPSHAFSARAVLSGAGTTVALDLELSRLETLPNLVVIRGSTGQIVFSTDVDRRVRVSTDRGSVVLTAESAFERGLVSVAVQFRRILLRNGDDVFAADRFLGQVKILEALANA